MILLYRFYALTIVVPEVELNALEVSHADMECHYVKTNNAENHVENQQANLPVILMNTCVQLENVSHLYYFAHHSLFVQLTL